MSNYLTCFPIYVLKRQTLDISFWRQFVLILAFVFLVIRQYFRFGDVNVSLKACKVFATFQFVSPIRTQNKMSLSLFLWPKFVFFFCSSLSWFTEWRSCFARWSVCMFQSLTRVEGRALYRNIKSWPWRNDEALDLLLKWSFLESTRYFLTSISYIREF